MDTLGLAKVLDAFTVPGERGEVALTGMDTAVFCLQVSATVTSTKVGVGNRPSQ